MWLKHAVMFVFAARYLLLRAGMIWSSVACNMQLTCRSFLFQWIFISLNLCLALQMLVGNEP